jgi:hypothetical protein
MAGTPVAYIVDFANPIVSAVLVAQGNHPFADQRLRRHADIDLAHGIRMGPRCFMGDTDVPYWHDSQARLFFCLALCGFERRFSNVSPSARQTPLAIGSFEDKYLVLMIQNGNVYANFRRNAAMVSQEQLPYFPNIDSSKTRILLDRQIKQAIISCTIIFIFRVVQAFLRNRSQCFKQYFNRIRHLIRIFSIVFQIAHTTTPIPPAIKQCPYAPRWRLAPTKLVGPHGIGGSFRVTDFAVD